MEVVTDPQLSKKDKIIINVFSLIGLVAFLSAFGDVIIQSIILEKPLSAYALVTCGIISLFGILLVALASVWPITKSHSSAATLLSYLSDRDFQLEAAIISMAHRSAWGRWYAAQHLVKSETVIGQRYLLSIASSVVMDKILDGELEVRGRRPGKMEYESIPRTDWRSSAFYVLEDPLTLWKIKIFPRGKVQIDPDGTVHAFDAAAAQRTSQLNYDNYIIDAHQFEKLWPQRIALADRNRRKFLREARRLYLDKDEIQRLSDSKLFLLSWLK